MVNKFVQIFTLRKIQRNQVMNSFPSSDQSIISFVASSTKKPTVTIKTGAASKSRGSKALRSFFVALPPADSY